MCEREESNTQSLTWVYVYVYMSVNNVWRDRRKCVIIAGRENDNEPKKNKKDKGDEGIGLHVN